MDHSALSPSAQASQQQSRQQQSRQQQAVLQQQCAQVESALTAADSWLADNAEAIGRDTSVLHKSLGRAALRAGKLKQAAGRKMCAGVFGASQAGKSYLISVLARPKDQPLIARFGDDQVDFIECINPPGGQESTGVVTRFTLDVAADLPAGHPIELELLTELDLVRLLANSYAYDIDHDEEAELDHDPLSIATALDTLETNARLAGRLTELDALDLEEYCNRKLIRAPRFKVLRGSGFWERAAALMPRLDEAGRAGLFSLLWEGLPLYDELFRSLQAVLQQLGFPERAFCAAEGLYATSSSEGAEFERLPALTSVVDVGTLSGLAGGAVGGGDAVSVCPAGGGAAVAVPRGILTALIAELRIVMQASPHALFEHTDLLDFPGARSRQARPAERIAEESNAAEELFLRGKVAYLFDRYCDRLELTSLLLCSGPENLEVVGLPELIDDWISATHGPDAAARQGSPVALFFVLSKFDMSLSQGAGKTEDAERWEARLNTSLIKAYGSRFNWPGEWVPGRAFDNLFCLRNPNIRQDALFDYASDESLEETGVREEKLDFLQRMRNSFMQSDSVQQHFSDPPRAWDAMMSLNDGGVGYLVERLGPLCEPALKQAQIDGELQRLANEALRLLSPYYVSDDLDAEREKKAAQIAQLGRVLSGVIKGQRFGALLRALQVEDNHIYDVYLLAGELDVEADSGGGEDSDPVLSVSPASVSIGGSADADDLFADVFGEPPPPMTDDEQGVVERVAPQDSAERFANAVEHHWMAGIERLKEDEMLQRSLLLDAESASVLGVELTSGATRLSIFQNIADAVRKASSFREHRHEAAIWSQVAPACTALNEYIAWLGFGGPALPEGCSLDYRGRQRQVFMDRRRLTKDGFPDLQETPTAYSLHYCGDWLFSLARLSEDNLAQREAGTVDLEQNRRLGVSMADLNEVITQSQASEFDTSRVNGEHND